MRAQNVRSKPTPLPTGWLDLYRQQFLQKLEQQGYTIHGRRGYDRAARMFCNAAEKRRICKGDLTGQRTVRLREIVVDGVRPSIQLNTRHCVSRFIDHLVTKAVAELPAPPARKSTALDKLRAEFEGYLRQQRGLSETTIYSCVRYMERFMAFKFGERLGNLNTITPSDIVRFLQEVMSPKRGGRDKTPPSHLRALFRFLFWSGKTERDLSNALPRVGRPKENDLPRSLAPVDVERILDAVKGDTATSRRNYAMVLCLARLGLRAPEVISIELDDIDWRVGTIMIRGKGKRQDRMPLPADVGKAIVAYLKNGRPGASRKLFVSHRVPFSSFVDSQILNEILRAAFAETGLKPPQKYVGSHVLRHSLATNMLRKGASLDEIGDVLRHRSRSATMIYARHDVESLRSIAKAWPVKGRATCPR